MPGKGHFLGSIISEFYASPPVNSEMTQGILPFTESLTSQLQMRSLSNRDALRERRGWGRIGLGSYSSF